MYIGIDPGKSGGIVGVDDTGRIHLKYVIPLIGREVDTKRMLEIFEFVKRHENENVQMAIEDVHSIFGSSAKSNFQFGWIVGFLEAMVISQRIGYVKVTPKEWQSKSWYGVSPVLINTGKKTKQGNIKYKVDTKKTSLIAAQRLFPGETFMASERSRVAHDGLVDAALIATWCRMIYGGRKEVL